MIDDDDDDPYQQLGSPSEAREVPWELRVQVIVASLARETPSL